MQSYNLRICHFPDLVFRFFVFPRAIKSKQDITYCRRCRGWKRKRRICSCAVTGWGGDQIVVMKKWLWTWKKIVTLEAVIFLQWYFHFRKNSLYSDFEISNSYFISFHVILSPTSSNFRPLMWSSNLKYVQKSQNFLNVSKLSR